MKYLVIEDDKSIAHTIASALQDATTQVDTAYDGLDGFEKAKQNNYDAIIADVMLPEMSGLSIVEKLRSLGNNTPLMIVSALGETKNKIEGLSLGADDYLSKPFDMIELKLRVKNLLKKTQALESLTLLTYKDLSLDRFKRTAERQNRSIELQEKEYMLLDLFLSHPNEIITKTNILKKVWNYDYDPDTNIVDVLVCRLRNKIEKDFQSRLIYTVRSIGYILK